MLFSALIQWGVLPVMQRDAYDPRAMIGFGIWLALLSQTACRPLAHMKAFRVKRLLSLSCRLIPLALIWCFFVYSFAWGNCLSEQKRYTEYRFQLVLSDLVHVKEMKTEDGINGICQRGTIGMSPIVQRNAGRNTLIRRLLGYNIPGLGGEGIAWFRLYYGMSDIPLVKEEDLVGEEIILSAASTHSISRCGDVIIVEWKENDENVTR